jgi:murein DD-endopeptidase MepM/ murein hydrolase activator NlpD
VVRGGASLPCSGENEGPMREGMPASRVRGRRRRVVAVAAGALLAAVLVAGCSVPRWPVEGPVSSPYGLRRVGFWPTVHKGVDVAVPEGTPVRAMAAGEVIFAGDMGGYGRTVLIRHRGEVVTLYAHLSEVSVRRGERVGGRQVVGLAGQTGNARGPHLHFEVRVRGRQLDPVPLLGGPPAH